MLRMASDPVPNIRFNVSKTLEKMAPRLEVGVLSGSCFFVCPLSYSKRRLLSSSSFGFLPVCAWF